MIEFLLQCGTLIALNPMLNMKTKVLDRSLKGGWPWLASVLLALSLAGAANAQRTELLPAPFWQPGLHAENVHDPGLSEFAFQVHYPASINPESLDNQDIWVVSLNGFNQLATFKEVNPITWEPQLTGETPPMLDLVINPPNRLLGFEAVYTLTPPDQESWKVSDNARYTVLLEPNQIGISPHSSLEADYLGTFHVRIGEPKAVRPLNTTLKIHQEEGVYYAKVTVVFPSSGFTVNNWGEVEQDGQIFEVQLDLSAPPADTFDLPVVTEVSHTYRLGTLEAGNYQFHVTTADHSLTREAFDVHPPFHHVPADVDLKVNTLDDGTSEVTAVIHFLDPYFVLAEHGEPRLEGNTFTIDAKAQQVVFIRPPDEPAITVVSYKLSPPEKGEYIIVFNLNEEPMARALLQFGGKQPPPPAGIQSELHSRSITESGGQSHDFQIVYKSESPIDLESLKGDAIGVQSWVIAVFFIGDIPLWAHQNATLIDLEANPNSTEVKATYRIHAPDRGWQPDMNGWLQVILNERTIKTVDGHYAKPGVLGEIMIEVHGLPARAEVSVVYEELFIHGDVRFESYDFPYLSITDWGQPRIDGPVIYLDATAHEVHFIQEPDEPLVAENRYLLIDKRLKILRPYEYYQVVFRVNGQVMGRSQLKLSGKDNPPDDQLEPIDLDPETIQLDVEVHDKGSATIQAVMDFTHLGFAVTPVRFGEPVVKGRVISVDTSFKRLDLGDGPPTPGAPPIFTETWHVDGLQPGKYAVILHLNGKPVKENYFYIEGDTEFHRWLKEVVGADHNAQKGMAPDKIVMDADGDGVSDFTEWALDLNPLDAASRKGLNSEVEIRNGQKHLTLSFRKRNHEDLVRYRFEFSSDLTHWTPAEPMMELKDSKSLGDGLEEVTLELKPESGSTDFKFIRMIVEDRTQTP